jgi:hypothetical protein
MTTQMSRFAMVGTALESAFAHPTNLNSDKKDVDGRDEARP